MTADVDLDTLTRLAQAARTIVATAWELNGNVRPEWYLDVPTELAEFIDAADPDVVLALAERVRAAEAAVGRVRALGEQYDQSENWRTWGVPASIRRALTGPRTPATVEVDPESTDDPNGPQNAANEGDA